MQRTIVQRTIVQRTIVRYLLPVFFFFRDVCQEVTSAGFAALPARFFQYSRGGKTKEVAEYLAQAAGVKAVSVDAADAAIKEPVDVLFVGGALYAYGLNKHLSAWLDSLDGKTVKKVVLFSTSWLSKHALDLMRDKQTLVMGMTGGWEFLADETIYKMSASADKHIAFVEGTSHRFTPAGEYETYPGQFGNTMKLLHDVAADWLTDGRFDS